MISRRKLIAAGILGVTLVVTPAAFAAETIAYTPAAFDAAQKAGRSMLVEIHATWCPTCKAQAPILADLERIRSSKTSWSCTSTSIPKRMRCGALALGFRAR
jgi:hypothetical protein